MFDIIYTIIVGLAGCSLGIAIATIKFYRDSTKLQQPKPKLPPEVEEFDQQYIHILDNLYAKEEDIVVLRKKISSSGVYCYNKLGRCFPLVSIGHSGIQISERVNVLSSDGKPGRKSVNFKYSWEQVKGEFPEFFRDVVKYRDKLSTKSAAEIELEEFLSSSMPPLD